MPPLEHSLTELGPEQVVVKKVYNNNVLLGVDRSGTEMVVNARGIGFGRHRGEVVDASSAQRYLAEGTYRTAAIASLLSNATHTQVRVAQAIVELAQEELGIPNAQRMMLPVLDHLVAAVHRAEQRHRLSPDLGGSAAVPRRGAPGSPGRRDRRRCSRHPSATRGMGGVRAALHQPPVGWQECVAHRDDDSSDLRGLHRTRESLAGPD